MRSVHIDGLASPGPLVQLWGDVSGGLPSGISRASRLEISDTAELDLAPLSKMTALRELTIRNVPGPVANCSALSAARSLERIAFFCCYNVDAAGFPHHTAFPRLTWISFDDVSSADAKVLRARVDGFWNGHVRRPRSRAWLAANDDNPFRAWADDAPELGRRASASSPRSARTPRASTGRSGLFEIH